MNRNQASLTGLVGALMLGASCSAVAQKVYRCGAEGHVVYQQSPCNDGKAIDASDPRSAEQRKAAQDVARTDAKAAEKFDRDMQPASAPKNVKPPRPSASAASAAKGDAPTKPPKAETPPVYLSPVKPAPASAPS